MGTLLTGAAAGGPAGAAGAVSIGGFSEPTGAIGATGAAGVAAAGLAPGSARASGLTVCSFSRFRIACDERSRAPIRVKAMLSVRKMANRIHVVRVNRSPAPRVVIRPVGPPPEPSAPPSERCIRTTKTSAAQTRALRVSSRP